MRVVMASPEVAPLAKSGGLADVVGALPAALRRLGVEVAVALPAFRGAIERSGARSLGARVSAPVSDRRVEAEVFEGSLDDGTAVYLLRHDSYFDRDELYGTAAGDYADNAERFAFFSRAVLALLELIGPPDVLHCHDWQSALAAVFLRADPGRYPRLGAVRTVLTVHNLGYQGFFWAPDWHLLNLSPAYFDIAHLEFWGHIDYLKGGLVFADALTTVSPTYAAEICTPELGHGLDGVLRQRRAVLHGILNGVDYSLWSPEIDPHIARRYSRQDLSGKVACKAALQRELDLVPRPEAPVIGLITRLAGQKGIDLLVAAAPDLLERGLQLVVLGSGEPQLEAALLAVARTHPSQVAVRVAFDEALAHRIQAGSDMLLMPSRYEPCGLNQMYGLRYGTLPVVRATGGLDDTVNEVDPAAGTGTGFKFAPYTVTALLAAVDRARRAYAEPNLWQALMRNAMRADFSWDRSARQYLELYRALTGVAG